MIIQCLNKVELMFMNNAGYNLHSLVLETPLPFRRKCKLYTTETYALVKNVGKP